MTLAQLDKQLKEIKSNFKQFIEPLNQRIKPHNMLIWFEAGDGTYFLNQNSNKDKCGLSFYISDTIFKRLMALSDEQLIKELKEWYL